MNPTEEQYEEEARRAARVLGEILGPRWRVQSAGDYLREVNVADLAPKTVAEVVKRYNAAFKKGGVA